jgi:hypothetical protein
MGGMKVSEVDRETFKESVKHVVTDLVEPLKDQNETFIAKTIV